MSRPLRVLYLPEMYSSRKLSGISQFNNMLAIAQHTIGRIYWYFVVPPLESEFEPHPLTLPNVELMYLGPDKFEPAASSIPPPSWRFMRYLLEKGSSLPFDILLNHKFLATPMIKDQMFFKDMMWMCSLDLPVITYLTDAGLDPDLAYFHRPAAHMALLAGSATGHTMALYDCDKDWLVDIAKKYLSPWAAKGVMDRTHVVRPCVDWSDVKAKQEQYDRQRAERRKEGVVNLFHGGTFEAKKHVPQLAQLVADLRKLGQNVRFKVKTQLEETRGGKKDFVSLDGVDVEWNVNRARYLDSLGDGDIIMCCVEHESTGLSYMEALYSGQVGVFLDRPWVREIVPRDYPFQAGSIDGLRDKVWAIVKDLDWARKESVKLAEKWTDMFDVKRSADSIVKMFKATMDEAMAKERKKIQKFYAFDPIQKFCASRTEPFTIEELVAGAKQFSRSKDFNVRATGLTYLRRAIMECGWADDCMSAQARFVRLEGGP